MKCRSHFLSSAPGTEWLGRLTRAHQLKGSKEINLWQKRVFRNWKQCMHAQVMLTATNFGLTSLRAFSRNVYLCPCKLTFSEWNCFIEYFMQIRIFIKCNSDNADRVKGYSNAIFLKHGCFHVLSKILMPITLTCKDMEFQIIIGTKTDFLKWQSKP